MSWLANSMRTRGVEESTLQSGADILVSRDADVLTFMPVAPAGGTALVFLCGAGVAAEAYAELLRPVAAEGFPVFVIRLPFRFAPLESHKSAALGRARAVMHDHAELEQWVIAGHSLGGALAARFARQDADSLAALVLVGTTHPKEDDLSFLPIPVTKVYASNDGVAPPERVLANRALLPAHTRWVEISGGNHSQFGRYGHQLLDGTATISRARQEALTRAAILESLTEVERQGAKRGAP
jgi:pimeloyl-ACP methyl ester carboxylesterase